MIGDGIAVVRNQAPMCRGNSGDCNCERRDRLHSGRQGGKKPRTVSAPATLRRKLCRHSLHSAAAAELPSQARTAGRQGAGRSAVWRD